MVVSQVPTANESHLSEKIMLHYANPSGGQQKNVPTQLQSMQKLHERPQVLQTRAKALS